MKDLLLNRSNKWYIQMIKTLFGFDILGFLYLLVIYTR